MKKSYHSNAVPADEAAITRFIDQDARPWAVTAALTALITGPLTLRVWAATGLFFSGRLFPLAVLIDFLPPVALITATVSAINVFLGRERPVETHAGARWTFQAAGP